MRFITLKNNKVIATRQGKSIVKGEIQSDIGKLGQVMNKDGTFSDYIPTEEELAERNKPIRIAELKELISNKKLLDMDCTTEQAELKELLGL